MTIEESDPDRRWKLDPRLKYELELAIAGNLETSPELEQALEGKAGASEAIWRRIADGNANLAEKDIWVSAIAKRVVADVLQSEAIVRPRDALKALGFNGVLDRHWRLRHDLEAFASFEDLDGGKAPTRREVARGMQEALHHLPDKTLDQVMKVIDRLWKEVKAETKSEPPEK